jgi:hypothetical protein
MHLFLSGTDWVCQHLLHRNPAYCIPPDASIMMSFNHLQRAGANSIKMRALQAISQQRAFDVSVKSTSGKRPPDGQLIHVRFACPHCGKRGCWSVVREEDMSESAIRKQVLMTAESSGCPQCWENIGGKLTITGQRQV